MGEILNSRLVDDKKVIVELVLDYDEFIQIRGHMHNVHVFSEDNVQTNATICQRGRNSATKYFLIPKELRKGMEFNEETTCSGLNLKNKTIFIYVVNKGGLRPIQKSVK